jgi:hypothetical protein
LPAQRWSVEHALRLNYDPSYPPAPLPDPSPAVAASQYGGLMSRSPYATTSALGTRCPPPRFEGGKLVSCGVPIGFPCLNMKHKPLKRCHSARRRAADAQRTQEVNPEVMK